MASENKPAAGAAGVLGQLSTNLSTILQLGAMGLLSLFMYLGFQITADHIRACREDARNFLEALRVEREHDTAEREKNRAIMANLQATILENQRIIIANQKSGAAIADDLRYLLRRVKALEK